MERPQGYNSNPALHAYQFVSYGMADAVASVEVPSSLIISSYAGSALGEGPFIARPNNGLPGLGPINILPRH